MNFLQQLILLTLLVLTNLSSTYANPVTAGLKLGDLLFNEQLLTKTLKRFNIPDAEAIRISREARLSIDSLALSKQKLIKKNTVKNNKELLSYIKDLKHASTLTSLLNKKVDVNNMSKEDLNDFVRTLSSLNEVAGLSGKNTIGVCPTCNKEPIIPGLDYSIMKSNSPATNNLFTRMLNSKDPDKLSKEVSGMLRKLGIEDSNLAPIDERPMALFLALKESGSPAQIAYVEAVMQLSQTGIIKKNGDRALGDLLEHRLWNNQDLFDNSEFLPEWTKLIQEVLAYKKKTKYSVEKSWEDVLTIRAGDDTNKHAKLQSLLQKGCFMKSK